MGRITEGPSLESGTFFTKVGVSGVARNSCPEEAPSEVARHIGNVSNHLI